MRYSVTRVHKEHDTGVPENLIYDHCCKNLKLITHLVQLIKLTIGETKRRFDSTDNAFKWQRTDEYTSYSES